MRKHKPISKETYGQIYKMLDAVSPLDCDCGALCGAACCTGGDGDMGIYLLPGEEEYLKDSGDWLKWSEENAEDYDFPSSWTGKVYFVQCKTPPHCPRERRPIQCRSYPLLPHLTRGGELSMVYCDVETPYRCPLIEEEMPLNDDFVEVTKQAWAMIIEDRRIYDLVRMDSKAREDSAIELAEKLGL